MVLDDNIRMLIAKGEIDFKIKKIFIFKWHEDIIRTIVVKKVLSENHDSARSVAGIEWSI